MEAGKLFHSPGQMPLAAADRLADPVSLIHAIKSLAIVAWRLTKISSDQAPLAMGGFATCLVTVSFAMMHFRDVTVQNPQHRQPLLRCRHWALDLRAMGNGAR